MMFLREHLCFRVNIQSCASMKMDSEGCLKLLKYLDVYSL